MTNQTINKLIDMRLNAMAETFRNQTEDPNMNELTFEERFGLMVDLEWSRRRSKKLGNLIKKSKFRYPNACVEDIEYLSDRKLNKSQIINLSSCSYIANSQNVIIMGASGNGKSYISCALGNAACRNFYSVRYVRLPELLDELTVARGEGIFKKVINQYKKVNLLILDEWLLTPLKHTEARDLFEIIESRNQHCSTIFCSQFAPEGWHSKIGEVTLADAILDRIIHNSYKIYIDGQKSMRERYGVETI